MSLLPERTWWRWKSSVDTGEPVRRWPWLTGHYERFGRPFLGALYRRLSPQLHEQKIADLRKRLMRARRQRDAEREIRQHMAALVDALRVKLRQSEAARDRQHRGVPSVPVIRNSLRLRHPVALSRARGTEALERVERFRAASPAYVEAAAASLEGRPDVIRMTIQGLDWWAPALRDVDREPGSRWSRKQKFPYRAISQTRELAVGGIMLDLGGNLGRMSIPRAILGDVVAAYCAEPEPLNYACLVRNVIDNGLTGLVLPDFCAIGDHVGVARLKRSQYPGGHRLVAEDSDDLIEVPLYTLDAWVQRLGIDLSQTIFIKVDVQGYEPYVIAGAAETLKHRHIAWQMEISPLLLRRAGTEPVDLYARLTEHFTYFTDLNKNASGKRRRPIGQLGEALAYIEAVKGDQTDVLLFNEREAGN